MTYSLKKLPFLTVASGIFSLCLANPSHGAIISYSLTGTVTSGPLNGQPISGTFSFDDAGLTGTGDEFVNVDSVFVNFNGSTFTQANATATPEVAFSDGAFLGLSFSAEQISPALSISFVPGFFDVSDSFFTYQQNGVDGDGNVEYTKVLESSNLLGILGLGLIGLGIKIKNQTT